MVAVMPGVLQIKNPQNRLVVQVRRLKLESAPVLKLSYITESLRCLSTANPTDHELGCMQMFLYKAKKLINKNVKR